MAKKAEKVEEAINPIEDIVTIELQDAREGIHTVFVKDGNVRFVNGVAKVGKVIAAELKEIGLIK